jgi:transcription termination/antitermination protein NusG
MHEGQIIRIIDGPFRGFLGVVKRLDGQIAKVIVRAYGRDTPVDLAIRQIELVPESSS